MQEFKLFMVLLGCRPPGRHTEQHDIFFGIASSLSELVPYMKAFWREAAQKIHIDAWREVNCVDGYQVKISLRDDIFLTSEKKDQRLFFVNLGGYQEGKFEEQHFTVLTVQPDRAPAITQAKKTLFFKNNQFGKAVSHVDDKYGIDVDDLYDIEDILPARHKSAFRIDLIPAEALTADEIHLGYLKLSALKVN